MENRISNFIVEKSIDLANYLFDRSECDNFTTMVRDLSALLVCLAVPQILVVGAIVPRYVVAEHMVEAPSKFYSSVINIELFFLCIAVVVYSGVLVGRLVEKLSKKRGE